MSTLGSLRKIEAMIQQKFSSKCDPTSLAKSIAKEVSKKRVKNSNEFIVPNDYTLTLGEVDFQRLSSARVLKSLYEAVERQAIIEDAFIDGKLTIRFTKSSEGSGLIRIESRNSADDTGQFNPSALIQTHDETEVEPDTIVMEKKNLETLRNIAQDFSTPTEHEIAILKIVQKKSDSNSNSELIIGGNQISIGRKDICDLTLQDISVSRIHANVSYERHRHILRDSGSHNGTSVNGKRIDNDGIFLRDGDKIQLGNSVIKYESL